MSSLFIRVRGVGVYTLPTMRFYIIVCLSLACAGAALGDGAPFEDLDVDKFLENEEQRKAALDCLMDRAPCGKFQTIRDTLPTMIETKCSNCTPKQKEKFDEVIKKLLEKFPADFAMIQNKYSPKSD